LTADCPNVTRFDNILLFVWYFDAFFIELLVGGWIDRPNNESILGTTITAATSTAANFSPKFPLRNSAFLMIQQEVLPCEF